MTEARARLEDLDRFTRAALDAVGADEPTTDAAARAMLHATRVGVDSHGVRLLDHYLRALQGGRVNPRPALRFESGGAAAARLHADDAHGARAAYAAMERAMELAAEAGVGAVAVRDSSHFGAAGAYVLAAAEQGFVGFATCNSDSFVRLHDGAERFHGTNPLAWAAPSPEGRPWLLDMATSAIPYNRVQLYRSLGRPLPPGVASDAEGRDVTDPEAAEMLAPLGAAFGFKGAGLAGVAELFGAILTGAPLSFEIASMPGPEFSQPRGIGAFVMVLRPGAFVGEQTFRDAMARYLAALRASRPREGGRVMAPGDREWAEAERREREGAPVDPHTQEAFARRAAELDLAPLDYLEEETGGRP